MTSITPNAACTMNLPFDILDHIFSFLITHPASLFACSEAHPVLSRMVEKYQYHRVTIDPESTCDHLTKLLSDKPRIRNYVRVLRIEGEGYPLISILSPYSGQIAAILPLLSVLECIVLSIGCMNTWQGCLPQVLREALEGCLRLPTLREFHINRYIDDFPVSMLSHANIDCFSLCGTPNVSDVADTTYPQLKSLSITGFYLPENHISFGAWAKPRITRLQSLKYDCSSDDTLLELLEICSDTLTTLDITLGDDVDFQCEPSASVVISVFYRFAFPSNHMPVSTTYFNSIITQNVPVSINLPPHLQNLTIRALIRFYCDDPYERCESFLSAAIEILKTAPSLCRITLEINIDFTDAEPVFDDVDLSPLTALADSPGSFRHIDLHFNSDWDFTLTELVSLLANYTGLAELMEQGVLVIHLDEDAPTPFDTHR
jgi:hypothetical protein